MGCSLFSNSHFQMGVTVMGFAEHFGQVQFDHPKSLMAVSSRVPQAASMHSSILFESPNIKDHLQLISKNIGLLLI